MQRRHQAEDRKGHCLQINTWRVRSLGYPVFDYVLPEWFDMGKAITGALSALCSQNRERICSISIRQSLKISNFSKFHR